MTNLPITIGNFTIDYDPEAGAVTVTDHENKVNITMGESGIDFLDLDCNLLTAIGYEVLR